MPAGGLGAGYEQAPVLQRKLVGWMLCLGTSWAYESGGAAGAIVKPVHGDIEQAGLHDCGFGWVRVN